MKRALEDGSYWVEQPQVVSFLLGTIERCAAASPLRWLPHEILQRIAQMAFRPRHQIRFELPEQKMPPVVAETWLARGGQCLVFPYAPGFQYFEHEEEEEEWGSSAMPYPTLRLPAAGHILYFELLLDDSWNGSDIHVHDVVFSIDVDEWVSFPLTPTLILTLTLTARPSPSPTRYPIIRGGDGCVNGTIIRPWLSTSVWNNKVCTALAGVSFAQRLNPWQREFNYAVNKPFWRHLTTGETSWHPPPAAPLDWRSFYPCACESSQSCSYTCARLTLGLLVDLAAGFVTFRLNQVNGPRVPLGAGWQNGVEVRLDGSWPEPDGAVDRTAWQAAIEQPLCVPKGLCSSPPLGPNPEWDPEPESDE